MTSPVRLNHAVLIVADVDGAERFYTEVFGMELVAREDRVNAVFLRLPVPATTTTSGCSPATRRPDPGSAVG